MRSRKAHPALFCLCNALKRFFEALLLLNWTQLSSPLRAQSRSIFPGKFSSKPHVRHSPDQAKRVNSPPLRLFRVRHRDPGGNRRISPRSFTPLCRPPSPAAPRAGDPSIKALLPGDFVQHQRRKPGSSTSFRQKHRFAVSPLTF